MSQISIFDRYLSVGNGFVNLFELQGKISAIDATEKLIHLPINDKDERHTLEVAYRNMYVPAYVKKGEVARVHGYIRGGGEHGFTLRAVAFSNPLDLSIFHGDASSNWAKRTGYRLDDNSYRLQRVLQRRRDNFIRVQGFVDAVFKEEGSPMKNGEESYPDCLHIMVRQFENPSLSMHIRMYGNREEARRVANNLEALFQESMYQGRRIPIDALCNFYVAIRDVEKDGEKQTVVSKQIRTYAIRVFSADDLKRISPPVSEGGKADRYPWASLDSEGENAMWKNKKPKE